MASVSVKRSIMPCRFFSRFSWANDTRKDQKVSRTHCSINFSSLLQREMQEAIQTRNTALCQKVQKVSLHSDSTNRRHSMWKVYLSVIWYRCNLVTSIIYIRTFHSLRSKRFRLKDRGTPGFSVLAAREMKQEPKNESWGRGRGRKDLPFFPTPSPLFYLGHFLRGLWLSFLVLCS